MKVAVFGGTFNPLHIGHAMLADTIVLELGYDKVLFVPTFQPPHKDASKIIPAQHRLKMIENFCASEGSGHFELEREYDFEELERKFVNKKHKTG